MPRILVLFAHPALEKSRVHRRLLAHLPRHADLTLHDLYEAYPSLDVDVPHEQQLLRDHDVILWQHPFYWYSAPPLVKQWLDLVLEHGWAYGSTGRALEGKSWLHAVTVGGGAAAYAADGFNRLSVPQFLAPFEATARLCRMQWLPPYTIHGTHRLDADGIEREANAYGAFVTGLLTGATAHATEEAST